MRMDLYFARARSLFETSRAPGPDVYEHDAYTVRCAPLLQRQLHHATRRAELTVLVSPASGVIRNTHPATRRRARRGMRMDFYFARARSLFETSREPGSDVY